MEYIAIALLVVGFLLIVLGFLSGRERHSPADPLITAEVLAQKIKQEVEQGIAKEDAVPSPDITKQHEIEKDIDPAATKAISREPTFTNPADIEPPPIKVQVSQKNPVFFKKKAWMYIDSNPEANYTGHESEFQLADLSGVRRIGGGYFTYDGFSFSFDTEDAHYEYPLEKIEHLAFYPNCVAIVLKNNLPPVLLFTSETESIRKVLEKFRTDG
ncbi:MAG: hypothetical protein D6767_10885 [Candidatus Hydrogenedentota bacterium]|nr:MAG: hypothetical protein D6767_10885 [Candidatus Hydrogenedentota bacterium]